MERRAEEKEKKEPQQSRVKRRVSLFKRRKKSDLRPFVREHKHREYKKLIFRFAIIVPILFLLVASLLAIRMYLLPNIFHKNINMLIPVGNGFPDDSEIESILQNKNLEITGIEFASDSASVTFLMHEKTRVILSKEKEIEAQLDLAEAVERQMIEDGKQAISIDLRYNKPIVRY